MLLDRIVLVSMGHPTEIQRRQDLQNKTVEPQQKTFQRPRLHLLTPWLILYRKEARDLRHPKKNARERGRGGDRAPDAGRRAGSRRDCEERRDRRHQDDRRGDRAQRAYGAGARRVRLDVGGQAFALANLFGDFIHTAFNIGQIFCVQYTHLGEHLRVGE